MSENLQSITPHIISKTARGESAHSILDEMFQNREILCSGDIESTMADSLITQILFLSHQDPDKEITMFINSPGGELTAGLSLLDCMVACPCNIHTVCWGEAASMAAVLFAAGDTRDICQHAYVMVHDPLTTGINGSALAVKSSADLLMHNREMLCELLAKFTGKSMDEIYQATSKDTYFYAEEAVKFNLADHVITSFKGGV